MARIPTLFRASAGRPSGLLGSLLSRKVPQVAVAYVTLCWGVLQFVDWLSERYALAPALTDFFFYLVVLLTPSVLTVAYFRGGDEPHWTWVEKIGVPVNLAVAGAVLWLNFQGQELGSINQTVTLQDSSGRTVERQVPKSAFRKRLALFFFENTSGDPKLDWLQQGIPIVLATDLSQDLYLGLQDSYNLVDRIRRAGFSYRDVLALGLERQIAKYQRLDYIVTGTVTKTGDRFSVRVDLYETERVKRLARRTYQGTNLFELVDDMSVQLKRDLDVPAQHIDSIADFPVAEVLTRSLTALEHFTLARNFADFDGNYPAALQQFDQATAADPSFATAYLEQIESSLLAAKIDQAERHYEKGQQYAFKLIERYQFFLRTWIWLKGQPEEALQAIEKWVALYPDDLQAHRRLAVHYMNTAQQDRAIATFQRILELDPETSGHLLQMGLLERQNGRYAEALRLFEQFGNREERRSTAYENMADTYRLQGQFEQARSLYQQSLALDDNNTGAQLGLASLASSTGEFAGALEFNRLALANSRTSDQKENAYANLLTHYSLRHQWQKVVPLIPQFLTTNNGLINSLLNQAFILDSYVLVGQQDMAFAALKRMQAQVGSSPLLATFVQMGYLRVYLALEDAARAEPLIPQIEATLHRYSLDQLIDAIELERRRGGVAELRKDYKQALQFYQRHLKRNPTDAESHADIGRCYRLLGDPANAKASLAKALQVIPALPEAHYELAEIALAEGDRSTALKEIQYTLKVLEGADQSDKLLIKAKALSGRLISPTPAVQ
ncbi:glr2389 [Gloeobacter violaceus PCC 7421]|uniref:Glr2389 protein n=1 Tax=Gloeobacter violaceus (strain ATCC 29082 / PCC 7421) TaxID=251221 RepID=Q7NHZ5_GLOVI|nr:glr2389 [Gloeobacter violaceus PCC 7421]